MEETAAVFYPAGEASGPAPRDLDDLIFQGELWQASDR